MRDARAIVYFRVWPVLVGWVLITGVFFYLSAMRAYEDYRFSDHPTLVTGTVTQKYITESHGKSGTTYHYHVSFHYADGALRGFCEMAVLRQTWSYLQVGGPIPVMYLREAPDHVRINLLVEDRKVRQDSYILYGVTGVAFGVGLIFLTVIFRSNARYAAIMREGYACRGVVTDVPFDLVGKGRVKKFYVKFWFRDSAGSEIAGRSRYLTPEQEGRWQEGDTIDVRYDRRNSRWFTVDLNAVHRGGPEISGGVGA